MVEAWIPYCGAAPVPAELLTRWNLDPVLIAILGLAIIVGLRPNAGVSRTPLLATAAVQVLLFVSPFCALTSALFAARTVHHLALTAIAAPLLAAALPLRRPAGGLVAWTAIHAATFWLWHLMTAYEAALSSIAVYWLMQGSLLLTALAMWRAIRAAPIAAAIAALLATMVQMGLLGALLTFSGRPFYAPHFDTTLAWGWSPLEDQQLAGLIMWAPGAGIYLAAAIMLMSRWFQRERGALAA